MLLKKNIPWTYVLGKVKYEIILVIGYALIFVFWHAELNLHHINIPITIPAIIGTIISLLLAFRSNQAYDRWWEARIIWGAIVNDSRTMIRQIKTFITDPEFSVVVSKATDVFALRQIFWTYSLGQSLRDQNPMKSAKAFLPEEDLQFVSHQTNVPNALLMLHGRDIKFFKEEGLVNCYQQVELDKTITRLCDAMGKCERIKNTVFPTTYSMYIHFALYLFIIILPFSLTEYLGIVQMPIMILIPLSFLLIEKMAIHLQDPFENKPTDTPMTSIAQTIELNLREMIRDDSYVKPLTAQRVESDYYQL